MRKSQTKSNVFQVDLAKAIQYLSDKKGKMEIAFKESDNSDYPSICLAFVKIPVHGISVDILRSLTKDGQNAALSSGKLTVDTRDDKHQFVGIIRVKRLEHLGAVVHSLTERMKRMLERTARERAQDNIGNRKFPMPGDYNYGKKASTPRTSKHPRQTSNGVQRHYR